MYPGVGAFVLILPAQTFYERINFDLGTVLEQVWLGERVAIPKDQLDPPPMTIDPAKIYTATLHTELGEVVIELLADRAPITVNNFVFLSRIGFYDGTTFHRVIPGFVAQGGDPSGTGTGGPGYTIPDEFTDLTHERGVISMANIGQPDTGGSQFFITYASLPHLDGSNTIFGRVITGMEVVEALTPRDPNQQPDFVGTTLHRVVIEERVPEPARIAFHSDRDGDPEIYVMDANGGNVTQLTFDSGFYGNAVWSPDGRQIAFESDRDGDFEIYVMDADGGNVTQLTFNSARDRLPTWSADGEEIAFDSDRDGDFEIYVMDADGSNVTQLTFNEAIDVGADWSQSGR